MLVNTELIDKSEDATAPLLLAKNSTEENMIIPPSNGLLVGKICTLDILVSRGILNHQLETA